MVAQGYGVALLPRLCLGSELRGRADLRPIGFAPPVPGRTLGLAWRPGSARGGDFTTLADAILELRRTPVAASRLGGSDGRSPRA